MTQSLIKIWIHAIWSTKYRRPEIRKSIELIIHNHIKQELRKTGCPVRIVNGVENHIHCLFLLSREQSISQVIKKVKGSTSRYINKLQLTEKRFSWQIGYAAYSVSQKDLEKVYIYIKNQKRHHSNK